MPDEPIENVNPVADPVLPAVSDDTPAPGQTDPNTTPAEPAVPAEPGSDRTVPLEALHEARNKNQELRAEVEALKQIAGNNVLFDMNGRPVQAMPGQGVAPQMPAAPVNNQAAEELEQLWQDDPRKAVKVEIMAAMSYRDDQESQVDNQIIAARSAHNDFDQYDSTVRQYIRALPLNQRSKPGVVDLAYLVIKGQDTGNAVERAKAEMLRKIQAGEAVQGLPAGTRPAAPTNQPNELNAEQLKVAEVMGLTPEQYQSAMVVKK